MNKKKRSPKTLTEIKQVKILKQIIMTPHPYPTTFLPRYLVLICSYINERQNATIDIEIEKNKWKCGRCYMCHGLLSQEWIDRRYWTRTEYNILTEVIW